MYCVVSKNCIVIMFKIGSNIHNLMPIKSYVTFCFQEQEYLDKTLTKTREIPEKGMLQKGMENFPK